MKHNWGKENSFGAKKQQQIQLLLLKTAQYKKHNINIQNSAVKNTTLNINIQYRHHNEILIYNFTNNPITHLKYKMSL